MPDLEYFVVAESVIVDQQTNRTSIINVLEKITMHSHERIAFPTLANIAAVAYWICKDTDPKDQDYRAALKIHAPGADEPVTIPDLVFRFNESGRSRVVFNLAGSPATSSGDLVFELLLNGEYHASHTVKVVDNRNVTPKQETKSEEQTPASSD